MTASPTMYVVTTRLYRESFAAALIESYTLEDDGSLVAASKRIVPIDEEANCGSASIPGQVARDGDGWIWASDDRSIRLWHATRRWKEDVGRRYRCYGHYRLRLHVDHDSVRIFGRCRNVTLRPQDAVAVRVRGSGIVPSFTLELSAMHRSRQREFAICRAVDKIAIELAIDVAPSPWLEPGEGQVWMRDLGRELSRFLGVSCIESDVLRDL